MPHNIRWGIFVYIIIDLSQIYDMNIDIANALEIKHGDVILVPGCEPISTVTSVTLDTTRECNNAEVSLSAALEAIPEATIRVTPNPLTRWFVLPEGPSTPHECPCRSIEDYYELLRQIPSESQETEDQPPVGCDGFDYYRACK